MLPNTSTASFKKESPTCFTHWFSTLGKPHEGKAPTAHVCVWVTQSCPALYHPVDSRPAGPSVLGILQARVLEWVAISFSRNLANPGIKAGSPELLAGSSVWASPYLRIFTLSISWKTRPSIVERQFPRVGREPLPHCREDVYAHKNIKGRK